MGHWWGNKEVVGVGPGRVVVIANDRIEGG